MGLRAAYAAVMHVVQRVVVAILQSAVVMLALMMPVDTMSLRVAQMLAMSMLAMVQVSVVEMLVPQKCCPVDLVAQMHALYISSHAQYMVDSSNLQMKVVVLRTSAEVLAETLAAVMAVPRTSAA